MEMEGNSLPSSSCPDGRKRRVCYYYDPGIANVDYGAHHVMVPRRVAMTHGLVTSYGLLRDMELVRTRPATEDELAHILTDDYLRLLRDLTPDTYRADTARRHHIGALSGDERNDNPVIDGLWDYCARGEASGFCYVNDIVLAIMELLATFPRVLYVDIDVHHGDGVDKYFAADGRVMTVSFHQYGRGGKGSDTFFFPGTGSAEDVGEGAGKYRTLNVPMKAGMDDTGYRELFVPIMRECSAQTPSYCSAAPTRSPATSSGSSTFPSGATRSASGTSGVSTYVPLLLLGCGGHTINHVASCWCYETAVAVGKEKEIPDDIPHHGYEHYYKDQGYKLHYGVTKVGRNASTKEHMDNIRNEALKNVQNLHELLKHGVAPSVQFKDIHDRELYKQPPKKKRGRDGEDPIPWTGCTGCAARRTSATSSPGWEKKIYEEQLHRQVGRRKYTRNSIGRPPQLSIGLAIDLYSALLLPNECRSTAFVKLSVPMNYNNAASVFHHFAYATFTCFHGYYLATSV
ncbi:hypothetical protein ACQ4PT_028014 [Festuca glaucescens]